MQRRHFIAAGAALSCPAVAQPAAQRTLVFVPQANLTSLDPIWTTATVTRNYAYLVFDTLYATDDQLRPQPQMAEGHDTTADGLTWTIRLRPGLRFHDNEPVLARDVAASLLRWMARESQGGTVRERLAAIETPDDRTIVIRLRRPFPPLLNALAKTQPSPAVIMPERLARTDPFKQVTEVIGSGPFRFVANEYVSGDRAVFARNAAYVPRDEPASSVAGGKRALVDRVEWRIIPDPATAAAALQSGEVDWLEMPIPDLLPQLARAPGVVVGKLDPYGLYPVLRFNHLHGPTAQPGVRRAILAALDPREVMQAVMGEDTSAYNAPVGCFLPGTPYASTAGMDRIGPRPAAEIRAHLAGYGGEKLVLMHPTDQPFYDAMSQVVAATCKRIGLNVDDTAMDWGTVVQRRGSKAPLAQGGWSLFCTSFPALDWTDPLAAPALRGTGEAAWYGWPTNPKIEALRDTWIDSADQPERQRLAAAIQTEAFDAALFAPLGQYFQSAAWRKSLTGHLRAQPPIFWNITKS